MNKNSGLILFLLLNVSALRAQTETFDIATFTPPAGWQRVDTNGMVLYHDYRTNNGMNGFCQLFLFPSRASSGNVSKDFKEAWNEKLARPTGNKTRPTTQTEKTPEGWTVITGSAVITQSGFKYTCIMVTATGFGKTMSVMVNTAGNEYASVIEQFFNGLNLDAGLTNSTQKEKVTRTNTFSINQSITLNDYEYTAPEGWSTQINNDLIMLQNMQSGCLIRMLAPQPSSGNLQQDAKNVFDMMYPGWQYAKTGQQQYILSKGYFPKGFEYFMMEAPMKKLSAVGSNYDEYEDGAALVVGLGNQIVIISVRHNSSLLAHISCVHKYETWRRFFNSFTVKKINAPPNAEKESPKRIIGKWSMSESRATSEYIFAANGQYKFVGALGSSYTTSDYNYDYLHIKTYAFKGDGSYSITGNRLTLKKNGNNQPEQVSFRFEQVNYGGTGWKERLYILTTGLTTGGFNEVCYEKNDQ